MAEASKARGAARVVRANRAQLSWDLIDPEDWLPADHQARLVWAFVETLDLTRLYDAVKAREGRPGRPPADPAVLLALWLLATIEGVGSARELDRLTERHLAYRWLANGVPVNYHGLADFRVEHADVLDDLLTQSLAALMAEGLVDLEEIIVDGTKLKASAGKGSFKKASRLDAAVAEAEARVAALKAQVDADPASCVKRREAARRNAAREIAARAEQARKTLAKIGAERNERAKRSPKEVAAKKEPRASLTDPDARYMRFADGAVRPGYNMQLGITARHGFVVAVKATDRRNDLGLARPMLEAVESRLNCRVKRLVADSGFACQKDIIALSARAGAPVTLYIHPPEEKEPATPADRAALEHKRAQEADEVKAWRERMAGEAAEMIMKRRKDIERVNAQTKERGLGALLVRGLAKVQVVGLLHAIAHNLLTALHVRLAAPTPQAAG